MLSYMAKQQGMVMALVVVVVALLLAASAATWNAAQLVVCAAAITSGAAPSAACCSSLKAQQGWCFCQYAKNPAYAGYINSPNARKAVASCGVSLPCRAAKC